MKGFAGAILALCLGVALWVGPARAADLSLYGRLPSLEDVDLSPDGRFLAVIQTDGEKRHVIVHDFNTGKLAAGLDAGTHKVRYILWADPENLIVVMSQTTDMWSSNILAARSDYDVGTILNVKTHAQRPLLGSMANAALNIVIGAPVAQTEKGVTVIYVTGISFIDGKGVRSLFRVPLTKGQARLAVEGQPDTERYLMGLDGEVFAQSLYTDKTGKSGLMVRGPQGLRQTALPADFKDDLSLRGFSRDGKAALVEYETETGSVVAEVSPDGAWTPLKDADEDTPIIDRGSRRLMGFVSGGDTGQSYRFIDEQDQKAWRAILAAYPGQHVSLEGYSADHKKILVLCDSPTEGPAYAIVDLATGKGDFIGDRYEGLKPENIAPVRPIAFKAADGLDLKGFLTLPRTAGDKPKGLPLVVLAHGGPASHDDADFDWWSQAMAAHGYAVLRVNFRGSNDRGKAFMEAGFGEWGKKMQTDLSDGVRYLAKDGIIDPKRVCIVGASYGGYAALAGATLDKGVYRCAASVAGPADLRKMLISARNDSGQSSLRYWNKFMGVSGVRDPDLAAISPASHAAEVEIPVLLVHGKDDTVVQYEQSQIMANALKKAGKPYEFVTLDSEDHWLSQGATRLKMLQSVVGFVEKNNPPN